MNGQSPTNNQVNQGATTGAQGINASVLGSVPTATPNVAASTPSVTPTTQAPMPQTAPQVQAAVPPTQQTPVQNVATPQPTVNVAPATQSVAPNNTINAQQPTMSTPQQQPVAPTPNPEPAVQEPVAQPIPGTSATPYTAATNLTGNTVGVGTPTMGQDNLNANGFVDPNKVQNIGQMPPSNNQTTQPAKKGMNKTLFIVLIIVAIAAVAFGVYFFLSVSNKTTVSVKTVTVGVGDPLSDNINDYATISGDASSCSLNTRNVNTQEIGAYTFTITCDGEQYEGTVNVSDVTAPEVTLNTLYKEVNSTVTIDEFVESCTDPSECTTTFTNESTLTNYLSTAGGPYSISITVTDNAGNESIYTTDLYVTPYAIRLFKNCESSSSEVSGYQATKTTRDYLPIGQDNTGTYVYLGVSQRIYTYVFANVDEYTSVIGDKPQTLTFDGITGKAAYDDENQTITLYTDLSVDTLNNEAGGTFPTTFVEINSYYNNLGYTCSNDSVLSTEN